MGDGHSDSDATELPSTEAAPDSPEHRQIGPYRLLEKLGEGGMGEVWLAEQTEPVRRRVALKIIKRGMDTERVVARFQAERQALALMNHPNVAKVFDAGATPRGRPYFAMEHVQGVPITEHCDRQRLGTHERLGLFQQVCTGVQHAHQKGIIHRDLKPTNVLVQVQDSERVPKIIDFGVAKATQQRLTEQTVYTELGQLIGTPEYMSPEQAEMTAEDIDTRTDVYSLGVLLYELLVGALPFDSKELRRAGFDEIRRRIREQDPSRPSQKVSTLGDASVESAQRRHTDVPTLRRQLRGDLDCIVMKALEKDRTRRYGSPQELAADIGRHLAHEPVVASPPSVIYRSRKFVRRHRVGVGVAALLLGVLVAFTATTLVQSRRIAREARTSQRVSEFLANMLGEVNPEALGQLLVTDLRERVETVRRERGATEEEIEKHLTSFDEAIRGVNATDAGLRLLDEQILARASQTIERQLEEEPRIAGHLEHTLAETYAKLKLGEQAGVHARRALEVREELLGLHHPETLASRSELGWALIWSEHRAEAEPLLRETLEIQRRVLGGEHEEIARTIFRLGVSYGMQNRFPEAETLYREALGMWRQLRGEEHPDTIRTLSAVAAVTANQDRLKEAESIHVEALEIARRVLGPDHDEILRSVSNLARLLSRMDRHGEAEPLFLEALEICRRMLGDRHQVTLEIMNGLAYVYERQGRHAEAEKVYREALAISRNEFGEDHLQTLLALHSLAWMYHDRERLAEAETLYLETVDGRRRILGDEHRDTLATMHNLAGVYWDQNRRAEAEALYLETLDSRRRTLGEGHADTLSTMNNLAGLYRRQGRDADAEKMFVETLDGRRRALGDDHVATLGTMNSLAALYRNQGRYGEAEALHVEVLATRRRLLGDDHLSTIQSMYDLAIVYRNQRRHAEAEPLFLETLRHERQVRGRDHRETLATMNTLAKLYASQGQHAKAGPLLAELLEIRRRTRGDESGSTLFAIRALADLYWTQGRRDEAHPLYAELTSTRRRQAEDERADAEHKNAGAMALLTCEPDDLKDPRTALRFALQANEMSGFENAHFLDTLAMAYHATGQTAKAVETQRKALALLTSDGKRKIYEQRLAEFEAALRNGE